MEAIVIVDDHEATVAFGAVHTEEVHRLVIHAEQQADAGRLIRLQEGTTLRQQRSETGIEHIEIATRCVIVHIGIQAQESGEA